MSSVRPICSLALVLLCLVSGCASMPDVDALDWESVVVVSEVEEWLDIPYRVPATGEEVSDKHKLDLYLPVAVERPPLLMWVHSGAWALNSRKEGVALARKIAARGVAVAAISHRLSPATWRDPSRTEGVQHPAHIEDCAQAFAWLHSRAGEFGYDADRMYASGHSSGGHLVALLAMDPARLRRVELEPETLRASFPIGGGYDIVEYEQLIREGLGDAMADAHVFGVFGNTREALVDASPITYLGETTTPVVVFTEGGTPGDTRIYSRILEKAVAEGGHDHVQFVHLKTGHGESQQRMASDDPDRIRDLIVAWILQD